MTNAPAEIDPIIGGEPDGPLGEDQQKVTAGSSNTVAGPSTTQPGADAEFDPASHGDPEGGGLRPLLRLVPWVRPYRGSMIFMVVTALGAMLAQVLVPLVIQRVVDGPIADHHTAGIWPLAGVALALGVAEAVLFFLRRWTMASTSLGIETDLRRDLYDHVQRLPVAFHDRWASGQLLSRMSSDLSTLRRFIGFAFVFLIANTATVIVVAVLLMSVDFWLGLFVAAVMIPMAVATRYFENRYRREARRAQDEVGDLATSVEESALGIRVIKSYGRRPQMLATFTGNATRLRSAELRKVTTLASFFTMLDAYPQIVLAGVTFGGAMGVAHGTLSLGSFVAFVTLYLRLIWPLASLGWLLAVTQEAASATRRIFEILDVEPSVVDPPRPRELPSTAQCAVRFEHVAFSYPGAASPTLADIDLEIRPGETMALVGATGSGKTTITALVPRLYDVTGGRVTIDGVDVRDVRLDDLRTTVAMAFEEATLFSASVRENLTLGRAETSEADIAEAIDIAQAGFVQELPFGLETRIGEQGLSLSGGQRQRLALARAVLGRPRVLVLDDPLSALDVNTESLVEEALRRVLGSTTALLVAHRPSTVLLADRVALLVDGRIADVGTHSELLARSSEYHDLLAQSSHMEVSRG
ncbi:MAG: ABC transporter ATP-binding protein [bacterium]